VLRRHATAQSRRSLADYCAAAYEAALAAFEAGFWGQKYPAISQSWRRAWPENQKPPTKLVV